MQGATGVHDLFLVFKGKPASELFQFDAWQFAKKSAAPQLVALNASVDRYKLDTAAQATKRTCSTCHLFGWHEQGRDGASQSAAHPQRAS